jgi:GNAT superfamily N-acetyltransferase
MIALMPTSVEDATAQALLNEYVEYRLRAFPGPGVYRPASPNADDFRDPGLFLVATVEGVPSGCGGVRALTATRFEVKHLYVRPTAQGQGLGRAILDALGAHAELSGAHELVLDTHSSLTAAAALYRSSGFVEVAAYNDNPNADRWYLHPLPGSEASSPVA